MGRALEKRLKWGEASFGKATKVVIITSTVTAIRCPLDALRRLITLLSGPTSYVAFGFAGGGVLHRSCRSRYDVVSDAANNGSNVLSFLALIASDPIIGFKGDRGYFVKSYPPKF